MFDKYAGDVLVDMLIDWGVDHIYGIPGDSINNVIEAIRKKEDQLKFIQVRHEEVGALAASSYAKLTGKLGVCLSIAAPGAIHLLNGLYDAKADHAPVLVITGQVASERVGTNYFQEAKLQQMFDDVSVYNELIISEKQLPAMVNQAIRTAYAEKGVAILTLPDDIPANKIKNEVQKNAMLFADYEKKPKEKDIIGAANLIKKAKKPVILAGKGAKNARDEVEHLSEKIGAPVIVTLPGKGVLPDDHPNNLGHLGQIGTKPAYQCMEETDLLIMLGTNFPYTDFLPENAPAIQVDTNVETIGFRYPVSIGLVGDTADVLNSLDSHTETADSFDFLETYQGKMKDWWQHIGKDEEESSNPIKPQQVIPHLQNVVNDDAILSVDVGNVTVWMAHHFRMTKNQDLIISSWMATMGCGLPGAIASKIAYPERQVVAVCGDGGFSMVMHDFITAVKYQLPMIVVVLNNEKLGMIKYEQQVGGNIESEIDLAPFNFAGFADLCGGKGFRVERYEDLASAFNAAAEINGPVLVDVVVEDQPPLPGHIDYSQAVTYTKHSIKKFMETGKVDVPPIKKGLKRLGK